VSETKPASAEPAPTPAPEPADVPAAPPRPGWRGWIDRHPLILAWIALAIGMVAILLYTSRDVGLQPSQTLAMVVATIALAGACVWIISWD
jgi:hypothetical protein